MSLHVPGRTEKDRIFNLASLFCDRVFGFPASVLKKEAI